MLRMEPRLASCKADVLPPYSLFPALQGYIFGVLCFPTSQLPFCGSRGPDRAELSKAAVNPVSHYLGANPSPVRSPRTRLSPSSSAQHLHLLPTYFQNALARPETCVSLGGNRHATSSTVLICHSSIFGLWASCHALGGSNPGPPICKA